MKNYIVINDFGINHNSQITFNANLIIATKDYDEKQNYFQLQTEYVPEKGDCLYLDSEVKIPRVKFKDLVTKGVKNVRTIVDATHVVLSNNAQEKNFYGLWLYEVSTEFFKDLFLDYVDNPQGYVLDDMKNLNDLLNNYTEEIVLLDYNSVRIIRNPYNSIITSLYNKYESEINNTSDKYHHLTEHLAKIAESKILLSETAVLNVLNGKDCITIDEEMYIQLKNMFSSSDTDNHILAMEIMSNCNYLSSLLYLEMLFKDYYYEMGNTKVKTHVNFQSLIAYLGKSRNYFATSLDDIVKSLINKNVLTIEALDILMNTYSNEISQSGNNTYFKVKSVTVADELLEQLNANYAYTVINDFEVKEIGVPEIVESESVETEDIIHNEVIQEEEELEETELVQEQNIEPEIVEEKEEELLTNTTGNESDDFEWF